MALGKLNVQSGSIIENSNGTATSAVVATGRYQGMEYSLLETSGDLTFIIETPPGQEPLSKAARDAMRDELSPQLMPTLTARYGTDTPHMANNSAMLERSQQEGHVTYTLHGNHRLTMAEMQILARVDTQNGGFQKEWRNSHGKTLSLGRMDRDHPERAFGDVVGPHAVQPDQSPQAGVKTLEEFTEESRGRQYVGALDPYQTAASLIAARQVADGIDHAARLREAKEGIHDVESLIARYGIEEVTRFLHTEPMGWSEGQVTHALNVNHSAPNPQQALADAIHDLAQGNPGIEGQFIQAFAEHTVERIERGRGIKPLELPPDLPSTPTAEDLAAALQRRRQDGTTAEPPPAREVPNPSIADALPPVPTSSPREERAQHATSQLDRLAMTAATILDNGSSPEQLKAEITRATQDPLTRVQLRDKVDPARGVPDIMTAAALYTTYGAHFTTAEVQEFNRIRTQGEQSPSPQGAATPPRQEPQETAPTQPAPAHIPTPAPPEQHASATLPPKAPASPAGEGLQGNPVLAEAFRGLANRLSGGTETDGPSGIAGAQFATQRSNSPDSPAV